MISLVFAAQVKIQMHEAGEAGVHRETVCSVADYIVCDVKLMYFI